MALAINNLRRLICQKNKEMKRNQFYLTHRWDPNKHFIGSERTWSNWNEGVLHIPKISITINSQTDAVSSVTGDT